MDAIFKALNDPARRALLDSLRRKDGQTLTELETQLDMSRFGVMKHLKVLEEANLVSPRKVGRFKYHYLNPLPLQEVMDRWIHPFLKPQAQALTLLKRRLEAAHMKPDLVLFTYINCSQDALWDALTLAETQAQHHFSAHRATGDHSAPGDVMDFLFSEENGGGVMLSNRVIAIDPKSRIEVTFEPGWEDAAPSRCVFLLEPDTAGMKLTIEHYEIPPEQKNIHEGWTRYMASLKTFLETGAAHRFAMTGDA